MLEPLYQSGLIITLLSFAAVTALFLGAAQLVLPKGSRLHRGAGYLWIGLLGSVALSSFWIHDLRLVGPFSPIHLLSIFTLAHLVFALRAATKSRHTRRRCGHSFTLH
ncbi:MAG: DUF2306 domain-containing protein [Roseobacter sp.]